MCVSRYGARVVADKLYIVDGHGYIFRAHYGLMNSSRGERREVRLSTSEIDHDARIFLSCHRGTTGHTMG